MNTKLLILVGVLATHSLMAASENIWEPAAINEVVYVESPTDTDKDGQLDKIYVRISRPNSANKLSTIYKISPYAEGGNDSDMHNVDYDLLPQDEPLFKRYTPEVKAVFKGLKKTFLALKPAVTFSAAQYAQISAHSVGTGQSTGCPTVGDKEETLAAKSVIDWLNGRARAFDPSGKEVKADWANGSVGMTGTSYDGTLPIMVATTGVEGLKAIVPIAAISNWYDYYRANGLVVNPGGYIGEDLDVLGYFVARKGDCKSEITQLGKDMGREHGDFTLFWQERDYVPQIKNIKAATFIIHGQNDWNVKQKHAIQLWEGLAGVAPRRMFLHKGEHGSTNNYKVPEKIEKWFAHFLEGEENGITDGPQVEVELADGSLVVQEEWPHEDAIEQRLYFSPDGALSPAAALEKKMSLVDTGKTKKLETLVENPAKKDDGRLIFVTAPFAKSGLFSGTAKVTLEFAVMNRKAANLTVAVVEYDKNGRSKIITRGWADAQNFADFTSGQVLIPGQGYQISFDIEPKEYRVAAGSKLGIVLASTDYEYTLRPKIGTVIEFNLGAKSFIDLRLSK